MLGYKSNHPHTNYHKGFVGYICNHTASFILKVKEDRNLNVMSKEKTLKTKSNESV